MPQRFHSGHAPLANRPLPVPPTYPHRLPTRPYPHIPAVKANSELEFRFQKMTRVFLYLHVVHAVPPVLNLPLIVPELFAAVCRAVCEHRLVRLTSRLLARIYHGMRYGPSAPPLPTKDGASADAALGRPSRAPSAAWGVAPSSYSLADPVSGAASAAERLHMEAYLAEQQSADQSSVKGIATAARDATTAIVGDQGRAYDLLKEVRASLGVLEKQLVAQRGRDDTPASMRGGQ